MDAADIGFISAVTVSAIKPSFLAVWDDFRKPQLRFRSTVFW